MGERGWLLRVKDSPTTTFTSKKIILTGRGQRGSPPPRGAGLRGHSMGVLPCGCSTGGHSVGILPREALGHVATLSRKTECTPARGLCAMLPVPKQSVPHVDLGWLGEEAS